MINKYDQWIQKAVDMYLPDTDWRLLKSQLYVESLLNPLATSPVGAMGIAQFMPGTWEDMKRQLNYTPHASAYNPIYAIPAAAYYMSRLIHQWSAPRPVVDRYCLALASYNAGFGNMIKAQKQARGVNDYGRIINSLYKVTGHHSNETVNYVHKIFNVWAQCVLGEN